MKKNLKLKVIALVLPLALGGLAWGEQNEGRPDPGERAAQELGLTAEQKQSFQSIMKAQHQQRKAVHEKYRDQIQTEMDQVYQGTLNQLESVLTPEQIEKFKAHHEQRQQAMMEKGHRGKKRGRNCGQGWQQKNTEAGI
ncbi:Spy/CpxP family protein refolding chaperone [Zooshikella harenae]|uniref:Periplasmic heavy metal sensor n=1 Tax=Zooshikella harenae TaxID=2827238 RepID=A0ABS5Z8P4_9GAMM|nr:hypothetical protein [Zooshikella harenae]MBU2710293.1 hypothetical protein [Zooshikella harenae]